MKDVEKVHMIICGAAGDSDIQVEDNFHVSPNLVSRGDDLISGRNTGNNVLSMPHVM